MANNVVSPLLIFVLKNSVKPAPPITPRLNLFSRFMNALIQVTDRSMTISSLSQMVRSGNLAALLLFSRRQPESDPGAIGS
ncbi:MAG: hypothetical protein RQ753_05630 [Desulfurivibrionaceae bacterium]|nr:hypothetical protein [Desulfurivibrionaceae bacterium]